MNDREHTLTWDTHCHDLLKKAKQRIYFLRKLRSFGVKRDILLLFYSAIIEKILTQSITVWYDRATMSDISKLNSVRRNAERIIGISLPPLIDIYHQRMECKINNIMKDKFHPAYKYFEYLPSGKRFRAFCGNKRFVNSFFPAAVKYHNDNYKSFVKHK